MPSMLLNRRSFLILSAVLPSALKAYGARTIPVGLELYSVRDALKKDPEGTVRAVAQMGYQCVEFYAPYLEWSDSQAKQMRKLLDELGVRCYSTHNDENYFGKDKIQRAAELNKILGSEYLVMAYTEPKGGADGWKAIADELNSAAERLAPFGLKAGYHNHQAEWKPLEGSRTPTRPMDILATNTKPSIMLQLDVGTCIEGGADPVEWIHAHPERVRSLHLKDWSSDPAKGYKVLFGEGVARWKDIFEAAENGGGVEYYLIEQEGSRFSEPETAHRCLQSFRSVHG